jgi:hypothetical protein
MASATKIPFASKVECAALTGTVRLDGDTIRVETGPRRPTVYYLVWRTRPSHPWHSEEFESRSQAHRRFFELIERGVEAYLEKRQTGHSA